VGVFLLLLALVVLLTHLPTLAAQVALRLLAVHQLWVVVVAVLLVLLMA
jgi:hypothetical protein